MKKRIILFLILFLVLCGCTNNSDSNVTVEEKGNPYAVRICGNTTIEDGQIICNLPSGVTADLKTYLLDNEHQKFIDSMGLINVSMETLDYFTVRNNYSETNFKEANNRLTFFCHNTRAQSNEKIYDDMFERYGGQLAGMIYLDTDYKLVFNEETIIGFQILKEGPINDEFVSAIKNVTLNDLSALPQGDNYTVIC